MDIQEIRTIAEDHGLITDANDKIELIHEIQREEGNFDCFAKATNQYCDQGNCTWREDCFTTSSQPLDS